MKLARSRLINAQIAITLRLASVAVCKGGNAPAIVQWADGGRMWGGKFADVWYPCSLPCGDGARLLQRAAQERKRAAGFHARSTAAGRGASSSPSPRRHGAVGRRSGARGGSPQGSADRSSERSPAGGPKRGPK